MAKILFEQTTSEINTLQFIRSVRPIDDLMFYYLIIKYFCSIIEIVIFI